MEIEFADNTTYQVRVVPVTDERRRQNGNLTLLHDISVRKRAEKTLQEREEQFRMVLDHLPMPVFISRAADQVLLYLNEEGAKLAGRPKEELLGSKTTNFYADTAEQKRFVAEIQARGVIQGQALLKRPDGTTFPALLSGIITDFRGEKVFLSGVNDITAHQQAEQRALEIMAEREKVRALNSFIHSASHDFRTPISTITANAYLIRKISDQLESHAADPVYNKLLSHLRSKSDIIRESGDRLTRITNSMLEIIRLEYEYQYVFEPCDFNKLIKSLVAEVQNAAQKKSLLLEFQGDPALPTLRLDATMIRRVVWELLDNAVYFTPPQGEIRLHTAVNNDYAALSIRDTGIGIAETDMPYIFTAFFRTDKSRSTKTGGAGLGLAIAKRIVDAHSGRIEVESTPGQGSRFNLLLPVDNPYSPIVP